MPLIHRASALLSAIAIAVVAPTARADEPSAQRCTDAYVAGQHLQREGKLLDAARELLVCARSPCPAALQPECAEWLGNVQRATPSIVIRASNDKGQDVPDARVLVDGRPFLDRLDGAEHQLDPGEHQVRVEAAGAAFVEQRVLLVAGDKSRLLSFKIGLGTPPPPVAPPAEAPRQPSRLPAYVFGGAGLVATGALTYFGVTGLSLWNDCHQHCSASHVDAGNRAWIGADVSLGVALASFGVATYFFLRKSAPTSASLRVDVAPFGASLRGEL